MGEPNDASGNQPPWVGAKAPCVYCGQVIPRDSDRCPQCRTSFSLAVRKASREVVGVWSYLDPRNPSGRGVTFETLVKMIEKGRIRADSIVRGPTTHQDWMYAAETPRLAKYLGLCPHCFAEAKPEDAYCSNCQLNMNTRPADIRPGIPVILAKDPVHAPAYQIEKQLADTLVPADMDLMADVDTPVAAPVARAEPVRAEPVRAEAVGVRAEAVGGGRPEGLRRDPTPTPSRAALAVVAAAEMTPHTPVERQSRVSVALKRQKNPKVWVIEVLTLMTLLPGVILIGYSDAPLWISHDAGFIHGVNAVRSVLPGSSLLPEPDKPNLQPQPSAERIWLTQQLEIASKAKEAKDYDQAIRIYRTIVEKTGDHTWEAMIPPLQKKIEDQRKARFVQIRERLDTAEKLSQEHKYDDALAVLKNLGAPDREALLAAGVSVEKMEASIRSSQAKFAQEKQQEDRLVLQLKQAEMMKASPEAARDAYKQIAATYPAAMVRKYLDIDKTIKDLDAQILAAKPPVPVPVSTAAPSMTPEEAQRKIAAILAEVKGLEDTEKFGLAIEKLQAIKAQYDRSVWPPDLDARIELNKNKKSALDFFGVDPIKKPAATKTP